jgi:predicted RNA-binding protein with PIN domain
VAVVLVDAENVRRSLWPNIEPAELVELCRQWSREQGHEVEVVFDGPAREGAIGSGGESADTWLERRAGELAEPFWLVTSDRALRAAAGEHAERTIGGGAFARELAALRDPRT